MNFAKVFFDTPWTILSKCTKFFPCSFFIAFPFYVELNLSTYMSSNRTVAQDRFDLVVAFLIWLCIFSVSLFLCIFTLIWRSWVDTLIFILLCLLLDRRCWTCDFWSRVSLGDGYVICSCQTAWSNALKVPICGIVNFSELFGRPELLQNRAHRVCTSCFYWEVVCLGQCLQVTSFLKHFRWPTTPF